MSSQNFPTTSQKRTIPLPPYTEIQIGDILVSRYSKSQWTKLFPWEDWHHAALITKTNPLTIIEAAGENDEGQAFGPEEILFNESVGFGKAKDLLEIVWLRPKFPNPIREMAHKKIKRSKRKVITEKEARKRVTAFARQQLNEPYSLKATKWSEGAWYCSLLVYKSYSRSITDMYLETYLIVKGGFFVTPEDVFKSNRTEKYFKSIILPSK